ncbi:MAK10-like protein [Tanacetum coccineum]
MYVALTSLAKVISLMPAIVRVSLRELWCNADDHCFIPGMADDSIIQLAPVKSDKPKDIGTLPRRVVKLLRCNPPHQVFGAATGEESRFRILSSLAINWLERLPVGSISTWKDLTTRFLDQFFPSGRTAKLRNDILMFQQHQGESLSEAISLPHDVPNASDRCLIELENQVQRLMEAHLALKPSIYVNKIASSCEICSGPQDTQYCIENPEQGFVDYASSRTDEAGGGGNLKILKTIFQTHLIVFNLMVRSRIAPLVPDIHKRIENGAKTDISYQLDNVCAFNEVRMKSKSTPGYGVEKSMKKPTPKIL